MKKKSHYLLVFLIFFACVILNAQTTFIEYDFENDTVGNTAAGVTTVQGTTVISSYTENSLISNGLEMTAFGTGVNYTSVTLDNFPSTQNYSVTWKQTISFANGSRTGVILKTHGASRFATIPQGYLFRVSAHVRGDWQHLQIIRYEPDGAATGSVSLGQGNLTRQATNEPRWYRATVNGANLTFEYSDNGDAANPTWITHLTAVDATYQDSTGGTMFMQGFQAPIGNTYFDDIQYDALEDTEPININNASITINAKDYKQTIDIIGGDMERSSKAVQTTCQNTTDVIQWGFGDINYNYCRVQFDKNQELLEGTKNWAFYDDQILTMQQVKVVNPSIKFWATLKSDYDGFGNNNNMPDWIVQNFNASNPSQAIVDTDKWAIFLADYLEHMENNGVAIHTLSTVKEWNAYINAEKSRDIINKLIQECTTRNITMPLINDSASWSMVAGRNFMNSVSGLGTQDLYTAFSNHEYATNDTPEVEWPQNVAIAESLGKKIYQDETITGAGTLDGEDLPIFRYAQRAVLYQSGVSGEVMFEIWSRGLNNEIRSIYWLNGGIASRLNGHYIAKHFANNVLDSQYIMSTSQNVIGGEISATQYGGITKMAFRKDDKVILWVMNFTSPSLTTVNYPSFTIDLLNSEIDGNIEHKYWVSGTTGAANIEGIDTTITPSLNNSFQVGIQENSINVFTFDVKDTSFTPDVTKRYYIDCPVHNLRLAATGQSEDAYTTSTSTIGADVEWQFVSKGNGYWHLQRAAGGTKPRLRTDNSSSADMQATSSSGIYTYYDITASTTNGTYYLTLPDGPSNYKRLQINGSGNVKMVPTTSSGTWVSFAITEVNTTNTVHITKSNATGFAIDGGGVDANGEDVYLWEANQNNANQQWIEIDRGNGYYSYQKKNTNYCIDGGAGGVSNQNVYLWSCAENNQNQHWQKVAMGDGSYKLIKRNASSYCIDGGSGGVNAQTIELYSSSVNSQNLQWFITNVETSAKLVKTSKTLNNDYDFTVYPNPVESIINIQGVENSTIYLYDTKGRLLLRKSISSKNETLNISHLQNGSYYLKTQMGTKIIIKK